MKTTIIILFSACIISFMIAAILALIAKKELKDDENEIRNFTDERFVGNTSEGAHVHRNIKN
jgi:anaerobic C4-dicarboxylate transporter